MSRDNQGPADDGKFNHPASAGGGPPNGGSSAGTIALSPELETYLAQLYTQEHWTGGSPPAFPESVKREFAHAYLQEHQQQLAQLYLAQQYSREHGLDPAYVQQYTEQLAQNYVMEHPIELAQLYINERQMQVTQEYALEHQIELAQAYVAKHEIELAKRYFVDSLGQLPVNQPAAQPEIRPIPERQAEAQAQPVGPQAANPASLPGLGMDIPTLAMLSAMSLEHSDPSQPPVPSALDFSEKPTVPEPPAPSSPQLNSLGQGAPQASMSFSPPAANYKPGFSSEAFAGDAQGDKDSFEDAADDFASDESPGSCCRMSEGANFADNSAGTPPLSGSYESEGRNRFSVPMGNAPIPLSGDPYSPYTAAGAEWSEPAGKPPYSRAGQSGDRRPPIADAPFPPPSSTDCWDADDRVQFRLGGGMTVVGRTTSPPARTLASVVPTASNWRNENAGGEMTSAWF